MKFLCIFFTFKIQVGQIAPPNGPILAPSPYVCHPCSNLKLQIEENEVIEFIVVH